MLRRLALWTCILSLLPPAAARAASGDDWTLYIANDNCPDYTWGFTEAQTRKAFADIVRAHLDEMKRTDGEPAPSRNRYNMAVTQEAICFLEHYPQREQELAQRLREGRLFLSPYLCNTLWGFASIEGTLRAFYPARRLEERWGLRLDLAEHIEEPSLPWGTATLLAGSGIRWLSVPYYGYDSTFDKLTHPPLFVLEGPDGSQLRVVMDRFASGRASYTQGAQLLGKLDAIPQWIEPYRKLGDLYPARAILASGTHGDISPNSGDQARGFADAIRNHNAMPAPRIMLVNSTLPQFCAEIDKATEDGAKLPVLRGCFGHSWDVWPVSLASYAAAMREGERRFLAAEAMLAVASLQRPQVVAATQDRRRRAEWCWAMLADHAWNGTDDRNKRHNAELRRDWSAELNRIGRELTQQAWQAAGLAEDASSLMLFNPLCVPRRQIVRFAPDRPVRAVRCGGAVIPVQRTDTDGSVAFLSPPLDGFSFAQAELLGDGPPAPESGLRAAPFQLEGPHYRLAVDRATGAVSSLIHKATGAELLRRGAARGLCQTVYQDGEEHCMQEVRCEVVASGPVLATLRVTGRAKDLQLEQDITLYADLDRVDFDLRLRKPPTTQQQRICQFFPIVREGATLRIETPAAVIRPAPAPKGDLLPGADPRRFAVQGFVSAAGGDGPAITLATPDAFVLRMDLGELAIEAVGNDQNHREVLQDQHGASQFRIRYSLGACAGAYDQAKAVVFARSASTPLLAAPGRMPPGRGLDLKIDAGRAIATCLKPSDDGRGLILRLWEVAGQGGAMGVRWQGRAVATDLLERDGAPLPQRDGRVEIPVAAQGLKAVRLLAP